MQKLTGVGTAWIELGGEAVVRELREGETLLVHPGHVGMCQESVTVGVALVSRVSNVLFGKEGLFFAKLTGPGM